MWIVFRLATDKLIIVEWPVETNRTVVDYARVYRRTDVKVGRERERVINRKIW